MKKTKKTEDKSTRVVLHVGDAANLGKLAMMFPRTFEAKRLIGEAGKDEWKVSFDPAEEAKTIIGATAFIIDVEGGGVQVFNPHVAQDDRASLDRLAELVAIAEDPFRWFNVHGTETGRTSCDTPNASNEAKAEDYGIHKDAVDRWADVDFEGLERRVMALRQLREETERVKRWNKNRKFAKAYGAADPDRQADQAEANREASPEDLDDFLEFLTGKVEAVQDNTEDNLGRIRDLEAKTKNRVNALYAELKDVAVMVRKIGHSKHDPGNPVGWNGEQLDAMGEQVNRLTAAVNELVQRLDEREDHEAEQREQA